MARKLSTIARRLVAASKLRCRIHKNSALIIPFAIAFSWNALLGVSRSPGQSTATSDSPARVVQNPFAAGNAPTGNASINNATSNSQTHTQTSLPAQLNSQSVSEPRSSHRPTITYQNPFSAAAKSPPVDTSLRPGPISRWRRPILPGQDKSAIKTALLDAPTPEPTTPAWDVLPPAEDLRHATQNRTRETDPTFFSRLSASPATIHFMPTPLAQPNWLTEFDDTVITEPRPLPVNPAIFDQPMNKPELAVQPATVLASTSARDDEYLRSANVKNAFAIDSIQTPPGPVATPNSPLADGLDPPEGCLEQAQHVAAEADSIDELSAVIDLCDRGLRGAPDEKLQSSLRRLAAWARNRRGELEADAGQDQPALADFQVAISLDPDCSLAIHNRAVTLAQQNQYEAALRDFNRVIELNPGLAVAYQNRAELLAAIGRLDDAVRDYNQALEGLPNVGALYRGRGNAYERLGDDAKALADFNHAIQIEPNNADAYNQRGSLAAEQGNFDQALTDFRLAISHDDKWAEAHRNLAWLLATCPNPNIRNPQEAIAAAEHAASLAPTHDYLMLDTLAAAYASAGDFDKAADFQQQALAAAPPEHLVPLQERLALYRQGRAFRNLPDSHAAAIRESP